MGPRTERGYRRVGYTWLADSELSLLTYSSPTDDSNDIHAGYIHRQRDSTGVTRGHRSVERDPEHGWISKPTLTVVDEHGERLAVTGRARSRFILPGATNVCVNSVLEFDVDGRTVHGKTRMCGP
ncbi:hypothetical protein C5E44_17750 [Nocardia nova]|nr:hypothetical protein C5E44_17750 [Nocardia nova]